MLPPGVHYVMGKFPIPSRYAVWAELGIIQLLVPNASFLGMYLKYLFVVILVVSTAVSYVEQKRNRQAKLLVAGWDQ